LVPSRVVISDKGELSAQKYCTGGGRKVPRKKIGSLEGLLVLVKKEE